METHKHNWQIITQISYQSWDDFMRYRGEEKDRIVMSELVSHKIFCPQCKEIKSVE
jgi:hypothetical protein